MNDYEKIEQMISINDSLCALLKIDEEKREEVVHLVETLHPNLYEIHPCFSIATESILGNIKDTLITAYEWILDKINTFIKAFVDLFKKSKETDVKDQIKVEKFVDQIKKRPVNDSDLGTEKEKVFNVPMMGLLKDRLMLIEKFIDMMHQWPIKERAEIDFTKTMSGGNLKKFEPIGFFINESTYKYHFVRVQNTDIYAKYDGQLTLKQCEDAYLNNPDFVKECGKIRINALNCLKRFKEETEDRLNKIKGKSPDDDDVKIEKYILEALKVLVHNTTVLKKDTIYLQTCFVGGIMRLQNMRKHIKDNENNV